MEKVDNTGRNILKIYLVLCKKAAEVIQPAFVLPVEWTIRLNEVSNILKQSDYFVFQT